VVVQSFPNTPTLDLDTVLFLDRGRRPLGKIFDVLGNIHGPFYAVRFNSSDQIKQKNIAKHQTVYFVPDSEYTSYVNTAELLK
jgi:H/ACA ribonucleoprotein complex non-core subunit NAF1